MTITLERTKSRIYFCGDTYAAKDRIKALGGHWDDEARRWWVGAAKLAAAEALVADLAAPRTPRAAGQAGLRPDTPAPIVADKLAEAGRDREAAAVRTGRDIEDPDAIRLTGRGEYQGRSYYLGASTRDGTRTRCLTLPDAAGRYRDFWADSHLIRRTKTYQPRPERGAYGRPTGRVVHQTLGSVARFLAAQRRAEADGVPACPTCGRRGPLHLDLEDGLHKCRACCDMPE